MKSRDEYYKELFSSPKGYLRLIFSNYNREEPGGACVQDWHTLYDTIEDVLYFSNEDSLDG